MVVKEGRKVYIDEECCSPLQTEREGNLDHPGTLNETGVLIPSLLQDLKDSDRSSQTLRKRRTENLRSTA